MAVISIPKKETNAYRYQTEDVETARKFCKRMYDDIGGLIKAAVLFGSLARKPEAKSNDIDVLLVVDDVSIEMTPELIQTYRILVEKAIADISTRLHITTLKLTSFWEYVRAGDPVAINILRDGVALIDTGFFDPLQVLLVRGKIRPTSESVWAYYYRAPTTIHNSRWHLMQASVDLYWAVIDAAHAALMRIGEMPPSPAHVADLLEQKLVPKGLDRKYVHVMRMFHDQYKKIMYREIKDVSGVEFDKNLKYAEEFVDAVKKFIDAHK